MFWGWACTVWVCYEKGLTPHEGAVDGVGVGGGQRVVGVGAGRVIGANSDFRLARRAAVVSVRGRVVAESNHIATPAVADHVPDLAARPTGVAIGCTLIARCMARELRRRQGSLIWAFRRRMVLE